MRSTLTPARHCIQAADERLVDERIHLEDEVRLFAAPRMLDLTIDALLEAAAHGVRLRQGLPGIVRPVE